MSEHQVLTLLALEPDARNHAMLRLIYNAGLRVSEVITLTWNDIQPNPNGGQVRTIERGRIVIEEDSVDFYGDHHPSEVAMVALAAVALGALAGGRRKANGPAGAGPFVPTS